MKVLVIEDDPIYQLYLKRYLEKMGLEVITASNGRFGIEMTMTDSPHLILQDMGFPDMAGIDCLDILKKNPDTSLIPVIVMTSDTTDAMKEEILYLGAHVYLRKPVTPEQLVFYVQKMMEMLGMS